MADQLDNDMVARILGLATGTILLDKLAVALNQLRGIIVNMRNNDKQYGYFFDRNAISDETLAWIDHIYDNLDVDEAWSFFWNIPFVIKCDLYTYGCLHEIGGFIEDNIVQKLTLGEQVLDLM